MWIQKNKYITLIVRLNNLLRFKQSNFENTMKESSKKREIHLNSIIFLILI